MGPMPQEERGPHPPPDLPLERGGIFTLHPPPSTLHPPPSTLHLPLFTLHSSPFTLHPSPFTLHPSPFTLHPSPFTLSFTNATCRDQISPPGEIQSFGAFAMQG